MCEMVARADARLSQPVLQQQAACASRPQPQELPPAQPSIAHSRYLPHAEICHMHRSRRINLSFGQPPPTLSRAGSGEWLSLKLPAWRARAAADKLPSSDSECVERYRSEQRKNSILTIGCNPPIGEKILLLLFGLCGLQNLTFVRCRAWASLGYARQTLAGRGAERHFCPMHAGDRRRRRGMTLVISDGRNVLRRLPARRPHSERPPHVRRGQIAGRRKW